MGLWDRMGHWGLRVRVKGCMAYPAVGQYNPEEFCIIPWNVEDSRKGLMGSLMANLDMTGCFSHEWPGYKASV